MRRWMGMPIAVVMLSTACVTINVYFPAAEAKEAAREFVEKVINEDGQAAPPATDDDGGGMAWIPARLLDARIDPLSLVGIGTAHAQGKPDITIKTPAIQAIQARMAARFDGQLRKHFQSGALGYGNQGTISIRDASKIPLSDRVAVNQAIAEQGRDANAAYREIAVANGHPEWEGQIRDVFAKQWIQGARSNGWWYQDASGGWKQ